jgi:Uma2 family endonuclease
MTSAAKQLSRAAHPILENGDHLTRQEFERRYQAMPELKKAELIEGVVYVPSPVRDRDHGRPHSDLLTWLGTYRAHSPGVLASDNATLRLDDDNEPQPDALLRIEETRGGQSRIDDEGYIAGAPELVAEVAASSASYDVHSKLRTYLRHGVREYVIWRVLDEALDWFALERGEYVCIDAGHDGVHRSRVFAGLWLDVAALLRGDLARVLAVLGEGLSAREASRED